MPSYLSQQTLKEAIERLSNSSATSSLADFLIFKRALRIAAEESRATGRQEPTSVVTGIKAATFVQAIEELTMRVPRGGTEGKEMDNPYYLPFGAKRDKTLGYRTWKYPSNGSSDTASRWQSRPAPPLTLVPGTSPKEFKFQPRTAKELQEFFIVKSGTENFSGEKPRLLDSAIWWFRFADLAERFGYEPTEEQLKQAFLDDFGLSDTEITALFTLDEDIQQGITQEREDL